MRLDYFQRGTKPDTEEFSVFVNRGTWERIVQNEGSYNVYDFGNFPLPLNNDGVYETVRFNILDTNIFPVGSTILIVLKSAIDQKSLGLVPKNIEEQLDRIVRKLQELDNTELDLVEFFGEHAVGELVQSYVDNDADTYPYSYLQAFFTDYDQFTLPNARIITNGGYEGDAAQRLADLAEAKKTRLDFNILNPEYNPQEEEGEDNRRYLDDLVIKQDDNIANWYRKNILPKTRVLGTAYPDPSKDFIVKWLGVLGGAATVTAGTILIGIEFYHIFNGDSENPQELKTTQWFTVPLSAFIAGLEVPLFYANGDFFLNAYGLTAEQLTNMTHFRADLVITAFKHSVGGVPVRITFDEDTAEGRRGLVNTVPRWNPEDYNNQAITQEITIKDFRPRNVSPIMRQDAHRLGRKGDTGDPAEAGGIGVNQLAPNAVTTPKIADGAVTEPKLATDAVKNKLEKADPDNRVKHTAIAGIHNPVYGDQIESREFTVTETDPPTGLNPIVHKNETLGAAISFTFTVPSAFDNGALSVGNYLNLTRNVGESTESLFGTFRILKHTLKVFPNPLDPVGERIVLTLDPVNVTPPDSTNPFSLGSVEENAKVRLNFYSPCLLYTSPSPRDRTRSRMPSSA